jgi:flagellin-like protein
MIRKIRGWIKDKAGVSPIIAIILMVAITVVLAATIYVWISGMGKSGTTTPNLSAIVDHANDKLIITSAETGLSWDDITVYTNRSGVTLTYYLGGSASGTTNPTGDVSAGDYIVVSGVSGEVEITLIYGPTNTQLGSWTVDV